MCRRLPTKYITTYLMAAALRSQSFEINHRFHEFKEMGISKSTAVKATAEYSKAAGAFNAFVLSPTGMLCVPLYV